MARLTDHLFSLFHGVLLGALCRARCQRVALALAILFVATVQADTMTLNLKDADIRTLVETMSEITGKNFVIDPRVKGKVTVVSSRPMAKAEIYEVFQSILQVHGFAAVETGQVIKILPDVNAKQSNVRTTSVSRPGLRDELVTRVIPVENVSAAQLVPILRPLVPQQGHLAAYAETNVLIVSDREANINRIATIVRRIDLASEEEIEVIHLEQASAAEVVRILTALQQKAGKSAPGVEPLNMAADERTNSILMGGNPAARLRMRGIIAHLDTPLESGGNTHVIYLRYANAKDLVPVLSGIGTTIESEKGKGKGRRKGGAIDIQADESANALVITAPPDVFRSLKTVIQQLDVRRAQVLVEAVIAELSLEKSAELGVQFRVGADPSGDEGAIGLTNFNNTGSGLNQVSVGGLSALGDGLSLGYIAGEITVLGKTILDIRALIRALRSDVSTNVLSTPSLMTLDNEEAEIVVGQNVPFRTGTFTTSADTSSNPFTTIERQDVGITLKVKPQINEGNAIKLDIQQEVSSVAPSTISASDLITNKRSIKTSVMVDDKQIIVLGGLIDDDHKESVQKVPVLGDIPLLGRLFRYNSTDKLKRNLMVFIRPAIARGGSSGLALSSSKYNYIRARQIAEQAKGVSLMDKEETPVLPRLDDFLGGPYPREDSGAEPASP